MAPNTSHLDINGHKKSKNELKRFFARYLSWARCHRWPRCRAGTAGSSSPHPSGRCKPRHILVSAVGVLYSTASENTRERKKNMQKQSINDPKLQLRPHIKAKPLVSRHVAASVSDSLTHGINPTLDGAALTSMSLENTQMTSIVMQHRGIEHKWKLYRDANGGTHEHLECSSSAQLHVQLME